MRVCATTCDICGASILDGDQPSPAKYSTSAYSTDKSRLKEAASIEICVGYPHDYCNQCFSKVVHQIMREQTR